MNGRQRFLIVTADDFGIGPATSAGILDAAECGAVAASVLLVNSPYAESGVRAWRQRGCPMALGWHPNLTLDSPILPPGRVRSLIGPDGKFWPLKSFLARWLMGRLRDEEIELELAAQLGRFAGTPAVQCPACGRWFHQSAELPCWTYSDHCLCPQPTALDCGYQWTPHGL